MENPTHSFFELDYDLSYQTSPAKFRVVSEFSISDLFGKYGDLLWENGSHKYNVTFFLGELNELLLGRKFSVFGQDMLDFLIGKLRETATATRPSTGNLRRCESCCARRTGWATFTTCRNSAGRRKGRGG